MRTITDAQKQTLEDLSAEGLLRGLPVQTAEKDIHVTELLRGLSQLQVYHGHFSDLNTRKGETSRHDSGIRLIFSGGTCLSKAYGLISRMSEDIDIKVILDPTAKPLKKGAGDRVRLKALHERLPPLLEDLGFPLLRYSERSNPHIRDAHRYYVVGACYQTRYAGFASLRPELKLELIQRTPLLPLERREFGYLHEYLAGMAPSSPLSIECISVAETAAEKVLSLLRRCAYNWGGYQQVGGLDPALVRHVYDVARIAAQAADSLTEAKTIFPQLLQNDGREFRAQNPEFDADPVGVLRRTLETAKSNGVLQAQYVTHLMPLVYDNAAPTFTQAFAIFETVAQDFIQAC